MKELCFAIALEGFYQLNADSAADGRVLTREEILWWLIHRGQR